MPLWVSRAALRAAALRNQLRKAIPYFRPDVVGELPAMLRQHGADVGCVETRHARFRKNVLEVDAGFLDHRAQGTGPAAALADGQGQEVEVARPIQAPGEVLVCGHVMDNSRVSRTRTPNGASQLSQVGASGERVN